MEPWEAVLAGAVLGVVALVVWYARHVEAQAWHGGTCRESGRPWRLFDLDSQGGRCYTDDAGHYCFVSYRSVDRRRQRGNASNGVGLLGLTFLVLLGLKLAGVGVVAEWSWWWVTAPLWGGAALGLLCVVLYLIVTRR